jgi:hypothetical protein
VVAWQPDCLERPLKRRANGQSQPRHGAEWRHFLAAELVRLGVDVIVTGVNLADLAGLVATATTVFKAQEK